MHRHHQRSKSYGMTGDMHLVMITVVLYIFLVILVTPTCGAAVNERIEAAKNSRRIAAAASRMYTLMGRRLHTSLRMGVRSNRTTSVPNGKFLSRDIASVKRVTPTRDAKEFGSRATRQLRGAPESSFEGNTQHATNAETVEYWKDKYPDYDIEDDVYHRRIPSFAFRRRPPPSGFAFEPNRRYSLRSSKCRPLRQNDEMWEVCAFVDFNGKDADEVFEIKSVADVKRAFRSNFECVYNMAWNDCGPNYQRAACCENTSFFGRKGFCSDIARIVNCWKSSNDTETSTSASLSTTASSSAFDRVTTSTFIATLTSLPPNTTQPEGATPTTTTSVVAWRIGTASQSFAGSMALCGGVAGVIAYVFTGSTPIAGGSVFTRAAAGLQHSGVQRFHVGQKHNLGNLKDINDAFPANANGNGGELPDDAVADTVEHTADVVENVEEFLDDDTPTQPRLGVSKEVWEALDDW